MTDGVIIPAMAVSGAAVGAAGDANKKFQRVKWECLRAGCGYNGAFL
jgi:hypothetical protein